MGRAAGAKLTLVSAPPGFGKTTLVADWLASGGSGLPAAWVSLDATDSDRVSFWRYVVAAIRAASPKLGDGPLAALEGAPPQVEEALRALLHELATRPGDLVLVFDDFHVIEGRDVVEDLAFFLDHLPPPVHVVITTRADPALPLSRLRARGDLVEIRAADLRFTPDEAAAYLVQPHRRRLGPRRRRSERGWLPSREVRMSPATTAFDRLVPHPVHARQHWAAIVSPSRYRTGASHNGSTTSASLPSPVTGSRFARITPGPRPAGPGPGAPPPSARRT